MKLDFKILVVEDSVDKADDVKQKLKAIAADVSLDIRIVPDLIAAVKRLEIEYFDMLILDLMIPAAESQPSAENSRILLERLISGKLIMPACVIGLTAYDDVYNTELKYFLENLFAIEKYEIDKADWAENVVRRIKFVQRWSAAYTRASCFGFDYDLVMLTARFENEFKPIVKLIAWESGPYTDTLLFRNAKFKSGTLRVGRHLLRVAIFCIEEMGMSASAACASHLIAAFRPRLVLMLGMCCGFKHGQAPTKSNLGDLIIVREAACWDEGKYVDQAGGFFANRAKIRVLDSLVDQITASMVESELEQLNASVRNLWNRSKRLRTKFAADVGKFPEMRCGMLVSGSSVVAHALKGEEISKRFPTALALEMEVYGVYTAVDRSVGVKPRVLAVKGVADFGDGDKHAEFQAVASQLSYSVALPIIGQIFDRLLEQNETILNS